jgi:hypothetical protein
LRGEEYDEQHALVISRPEILLVIIPKSSDKSQKKKVRIHWLIIIFMILGSLPQSLIIKTHIQNQSYIYI